MTINQFQLTNSDKSLAFEKLRDDNWVLIDEQIATFREDAKLLREMACTYPGDPEMTLNYQAFLLDNMASALESYCWKEHVWDFYDNWEPIEVTYA